MAGLGGALPPSAGPTAVTRVGTTRRVPALVVAACRRRKLSRATLPRLLFRRLSRGSPFFGGLAFPPGRQTGPGLGQTLVFRKFAEKRGEGREKVFFILGLGLEEVFFYFSLEFEAGVKRRGGRFFARATDL